MQTIARIINWVQLSRLCWTGTEINKISLSFLYVTIYDSHVWVWDTYFFLLGILAWLWKERKKMLFRSFFNLERTPSIAYLKHLSSLPDYKYGSMLRLLYSTFRANIGSNNNMLGVNETFLTLGMSHKQCHLAISVPKNRNIWFATHISWQNKYFSCIT